MVLLSVVLDEFRTELPDDIRDHRLLVNGKAFTKNVRTEFFPHFTSSPQRLFTRGNPQLDDHAANQLRQELGKLSDVFTVFGRWAIVLKDESTRTRSTFNARDRLVAARALTVAHPHDDPTGLSEEDRIARAQDALGIEKRRSRGSTTLSPDARTMLDERIRRAWALRREPVGGRLRRDVEERILQGIAWEVVSDQRVPVPDDDAQLAWSSLVATYADGEGISDEQAFAMGLADADHLVPPELGRHALDADTGAGHAFRPLSQNIRAREYRVSKLGKEDSTGRQAMAYIASVPYIDILTALIDASPRPFGLNAAWSQATMHMVAHVSSALTSDENPANRRLLASALTGVGTGVLSQWQFRTKEFMTNSSRRVSSARGESVAYVAGNDHFLTDTRGSSAAWEFARDPAGFLMGRAWIRVAREEIGRSHPLTAGEMWHHVRGAIESGIREMPRIAAGAVRRDRTTSATEFFERAARTFGAEAVLDVLMRLHALPPHRRMPNDLRATIANWQTTLFAEGEPVPRVGVIKEYANRKAQAIAQRREALERDEADSERRLAALRREEARMHADDTRDARAFDPMTASGGRSSTPDHHSHGDERP